MKDSIFECKSIQTKDNLRKMTSRLMRVHLIIHAAVICMLSLGFLILVILERKDTYLSFALVLFFACLGLAIFRFDNVPKKYAEKTYNNNILLYGETVTTIVKVFEIGFVTENTLMHIIHQYSYEELDKFYETKDLYLLKTNKKKIILINKHNFIKGNSSDFGEFIRLKTNSKKILSDGRN